MARESVEFDVVVVGAGPAGLSAACRMKQLAAEAQKDISVCILEKGSEVGAHIVSGAVFEPTALNELFPAWREEGAPVSTVVQREEVNYLIGAEKALSVPRMFTPLPMRNEGNYIISLAELCRWLGRRAQAMGVDIFPGFAAADVLYDERGAVSGVITGDMGIGKDGEPKPGFQPGMEIRGKYTIFAEGCRGHLGKRLMERFRLQSTADPQHYGIGIKEIWNIEPACHRQGLVVHTLGWPLDNWTEGGGFLYHLDNNQVSVGFIVALNYRNPYLNPFEEMQRWKGHPCIRRFLEGGSRVAYGARAVNKGGFQSVPRLSFPGGLLAGCEAGFLNGAKIKGNHTAMKTGMLAAETVFEAFAAGDAGGNTLTAMDEKYSASWVFTELRRTRNFAPALHKLGTFAGAAFVWLDQNVFRGKMPFTLHNRTPDHACLKQAKECQRIDYPRHDGKISFDILSSVYLSNTHHEDDQPCHLKLADPSVPTAENLPGFDEPAQRYCPAKVYEIVRGADGLPVFQINAQNCIHCKTCDIKDPAQNITWVPPEGGGGPNYSNM